MCSIGEPVIKCRYKFKRPFQVLGCVTFQIHTIPLPAELTRLRVQRSAMGIQCPPFGTPCQYRLNPKHSAKIFKATNPTHAPVCSQKNKQSGRTPAGTADMPLVPRASWPPGIPNPSRRKGKSVSPSTSEGAVSTSPTTTVEVQARPPRSRTLKRSSSCGSLLHAQPGRPHKETWEARTIYSILYHAMEAPGSYKGPDNDDLRLCRAQSNSVSCTHENRAGKTTQKCTREKTHFEFMCSLSLCLCPRTVSDESQPHAKVGFSIILDVLGSMLTLTL
ncbi:hypothetical protein EDB92DRAFT_1858583, partial [Lactarius akahatsu]